MPDHRLAVSLRQDGPIPLDVEFSCDPGHVLAIFGPSGSGKTTILRAIAGLARPAHGRVQSGADTWTDTDAGVFWPPHRRAVGFVFQEYALFPHLTALGNVMTALGHRPRPERRARAAELLDAVHLKGHDSKRPRELSGGERQRVALARALAREPAVLLLDEPFAAVDRAVRRRLQSEIDSLRRTLRVPLILVTHDFDDVVRLATHVLMLDHGRSVAIWLVVNAHESAGSVLVARSRRTRQRFRGGGEPRRSRSRPRHVGVRRRHAARTRSSAHCDDDCPRADPGTRSHPGDERPNGTQPSQCVAGYRVRNPRRHDPRCGRRSDDGRPNTATCRSDARRDQHIGNQGWGPPACAGQVGLHRGARGGYERV